MRKANVWWRDLDQDTEVKVQAIGSNSVYIATVNGEEALVNWSSTDTVRAEIFLGKLAAETEKKRGNKWKI